MKHFVLALGLTYLTACGNNTAATIAALEVGLTAAERAALAYTTLPACTATNPTVCSNPMVKASIKAEDNVAYNAVKAAEANPSSANVTAAQAALAAYLAMVPKTGN